MQEAKKQAQIVWVPAGAGHFALRGRPGKALVPTWPSLGCTHVVTLQGERERAHEVGNWVSKADMEWINIPLDCAKSLTYGQVIPVLEKVTQICEALEKGAKVLFHCAAGLHRTGMISYTCLLYLGCTPEGAYEKLKEARIETANGVGWRLKVGEAFVKLCGTMSNPTPDELIQNEVAHRQSQYLFEQPPKPKREQTQRQNKKEQAIATKKNRANKGQHDEIV